MKKYIKKPIVIDAVQWDGTEEHAVEIASLPGFEGRLNYNHKEFISFHVETLEGLMRIQPKSYIIRGVKGEYYACREDIFLETYDINISI